MSRATWGLGLPVAVVGVAVAVWAGPNLAIAVPAAALAVLAATMLSAGVLRSGEKDLPERYEIPLTSPMAALRAAFASGSLGRQYVLREIDMLDRNLRGRPVTFLPPEVQRRILRAPPQQFREYVGERLDELEAES